MLHTCFFCVRNMSPTCNTCFKHVSDMKKTCQKHISSRLVVRKDYNTSQDMLSEKLCFRHVWNYMLLHVRGEDMFETCFWYVPTCSNMKITCFKHVSHMFYISHQTRCRCGRQLCTIERCSVWEKSINFCLQFRQLLFIYTHTTDWHRFGMCKILAPDIAPKSWRG